MGIIQNALNQMIGTVGIAARLAPGYETRQELHQLGKKEKALSLQQEALPTLEPNELEEGKTIAAKQHKEILEKQSEIAQRQFELKPSKETMKKATFARSGAGEGPLFTTPADPDEIRQEQAMLKVAEKQESKKGQKRNFMEYLGNLKASGLGKVSDLEPDLQKKIAGTYSPYQRQKLMDQMDKDRRKK